MSETVTIGDTDVEVRETEDGFEAVAVEEPFVEYVKNIEGVLDGSNEFSCRNDRFIDISYRYMLDSEMAALDADDGVEIGSIDADDDGNVVVSLKDVRE